MPILLPEPEKYICTTSNKSIHLIMNISIDTKISQKPIGSLNFLSKLVDLSQVQEMVTDAEGNPISPRYKII